LGEKTTENLLFKQGEYAAGVIIESCRKKFEVEVELQKKLGWRTEEWDEDDSWTTNGGNGRRMKQQEGRHVLSE
jgi:hypothetical protein